MSNSKNSRRQFLKNIPLVALPAITPQILNSQPESSNQEQSGNCYPTTPDYYGEGPFYTENPPTIEANQLATAAEPGEKMIISGRVLNLDCTEFIPNATIDVWHANNAGNYDNDGYNLRGVTTSNDQGFYIFETIKPGKYLNGNAFRPSHIHFKITAPGFETLTTQLYFEGDPDLESDAASSITTGQFNAQNRIIPLTKEQGGGLEGTWDINVNGEGETVGVNTLHIEKGVIYQIGPNPFTAELNIRYGIFKPANVSLLVFDLEGRAIATLEEKQLGPSQYDATWVPDISIPNGHYFIVLKINDLQIHYRKVVFERGAY